ncbi:MAG: hypothetical protein ACI80S_001752 [Pseudohongiellaceae bacterium]|jgi:hypothetical protein
MTENFDLQALLDTMIEGHSNDLLSFLEADGDANTLDPRWNCSILFHAIFGGNLESVGALVKAGANVNHPAKDPASDILAATPTALAVQCRTMMDHDKYDPIVKLLEEHGGIEQPQL